MFDRIAYVASPSLLAVTYAMYVKKDRWAGAITAMWSIPVWALATTFLVLKDVRLALIPAAIVALAAAGRWRCQSRRRVTEGKSAMEWVCPSFAMLISQAVALAAGIGGLIALVILGVRKIQNP